MAAAMLSLGILLWSAGALAAAPGTARLISVVGGEVDPSDRAVFELRPGGVAVIEVSGERKHCVHLDQSPGRYRLGADGEALRPLSGSAATSGRPTWACTRVTRGQFAGARAGADTVFVLGLEGRGVPPSTASLLGDLVAARLADHEGLSVLSGADVNDMLTLEAERAASGCEETSCLAELAGALGARYVVSGQVDDEGGLLRLALTLFDTSDARVAGRAEVRGRDLEDLGARVRAAVHNLLAERFGLAPLPVAEVRAGRRVLDGGALGAAAVAGGLPCLAGVACLSAPALALALFAPLLLADTVLPLLFGAPLCCSAAPCLAAPLGSVVGDRLLGYASSLWRPLLVAAAVVPVWGFLLVLTSAGALIAAAVADPSATGPIAPSSAIAALLTAAIGTALSSAVVLAAGFVAHEVGIALVGDAPALDDELATEVSLFPAPPPERRVAMAY